MFRWFADPVEFRKEVNTLRSTVTADEAALSHCSIVQGWCDWCGRASSFRVAGGANFGNRANLREGMMCSHCKLTNRQRLIACAVQQRAQEPGGRIALLEQTSSLFRSIKRRYAATIGSEFLGPNKKSGNSYFWLSSSSRPRYTRHEDITNLSYEASSLDVIAHSDVLEHVYDYRAALRECFRVLRPGGSLIFTVPYFHNQDASVVRGIPNLDGTITHLELPEYHGDGLKRQGIYTFHHFGGDLIGEMRAAGFISSTIGMWYEPTHGFCSANAEDESLDMMPLLFKASR